MLSARYSVPASLYGGLLPYRLDLIAPAKCSRPVPIFRGLFKFSRTNPHWSQCGSGSCNSPQYGFGFSSTLKVNKKNIVFFFKFDNLFAAHSQSTLYKKATDKNLKD
jgi:hypothetical protein